MSIEDLANSAGISAEDRELLAMLLADEGIAFEEEEDVIPRRPRGEDSPLSFAQERLWFVDQLVPGTSAYNMGQAVRLDGPLDLGDLARTFAELARRHETLRTVFAVRGGRPVQVVRPAGPVATRLVDLAELPAARREAVAGALVAAESLRPFDLAAGPLLRVLLVRLSPTSHAVQFSMHHIVTDGWSMGVLINELGALYSAVSRGLPSPLPELSIQYADFADWQRRWLDGDVLAKQVGYWRERLEGTQTLDLPTDRPRPVQQSFRGAALGIRVDRRTSEGLAALSRRAGATPFMTLLAAMGELLHRYSGQVDVPVGSTIANRNRRELEGLIGFFVNTLVMRVDLAGDPTFLGLLARVREVALGAYGHQDLPFERLIGELGLERDLSRSPLFQVVFQLQNTPTGSIETRGLSLTRVEQGIETAKFDLVLNMAESPAGLSGSWRYSTDLFDAATVARMSRHLGTLLAGIAADAGRPLSQLPLLTPAERHQLLAEWGTSAADGSPAATALHQAFAAVAAGRPEATALVFGEERVSYGELDRRANRLARRLLALGAGPGVPVGLLLPRSAELVTALLAVLKTGGAYVPIDPTYPADRVVFVLADSGVPVLISDSRVTRGLSGGELASLDGSARPRLLLLDEERASPAGEEALERVDIAGIDPGAAWSADSPAYVIYTSGSTGRPKGVAVTHANALRLFSATEAWFGFGPEDAWTLFHSYAFDFSVWELWGALLHGGRLVVVPWEVSRSPEDFYELLGREGVTVLNQTPSAFRQLVWAEESARARGAGALALRWVVFGGEALEPASLAPWFERHGEEAPRLVNMYGITETTVHVTFRPLTRKDALSGAGSRIGRPIPDLALYLLDAEGRPVPVGVAGEIHVGGAGVATGYLGRPELTAERFVPDPFGGNGAPAPGTRLYRSGDLGRYLPDGDIEYLGRIDHQVKIRGFRIELGEVEAALARCPGVREAVVLARQDAGDEGHERRLVAYVVADPGSAPTLAGVRDHLAGSLPDYMLPAALVHLEAMPLTGNGKVDRRALPAPGGSALPEEGYVAPSQEIEAFLAGLFQEVLKLERVGLHDDFFALGGDSIKGAVLINRLQQELQEIVHVVAIFDAPTVAKLAAYLAAEHSKAVVRLWGEDALTGGQAAEAGPSAPVATSEDDLALFRSLIQPLPPLGAGAAAGTPRNPRAVFVLSPPRSGSTLLRVMLGGHPGLFAPPELELLSFDTLEERRAAFSGRDSFWLEGTLRAVMESRGCGPEEAEEILAGCEREGLSTAAFYGRLQSWIGGRVLVDKTPSYALDPGALARAEEAFDRPFYIHLIRHPLGMIRSFEEAKLDQIFFRREHPFSRRQLAELIWLASHQNIVALLGGVPPERQRWVYFEDLVRDPAGTLQGLCEALGIEYHEEMAAPYEGERSRMTDGPHAESRMLGDVKFHQHGRVDPAVAERWREAGDGGDLGEPTWEMAVELGYLRELRELREVPEVRERPESGKLPAPGAWSRIERGSWATGEPLPLSFAQERLWFLDQLDPGTGTYNIPEAFRLRGTLDVPALSASLDEIVRRHASLRTTFGLADGKPVQVVAPAGFLPLPLIDLADLPAEARGPEMRRLVLDEEMRPFDLVRGPLLRSSLARLEPTEHAVLFTMHHIVSDGWSIGVLEYELDALYRSFVQRLPSPLPELPIQYADFALWQRGRLGQRTLEADLAYWRETLADLAVLELPADRPRPPVQTAHGALLPIVLPAGLGENLARLGREEGMTPFMLLLAGFAALLHRWSGQDDVAIGTPVANRPHREIEMLIGFFVNTLVLRADCSRDPGFRDLLARVRATVLGAFAHQEVPFERVVDELQPRRDPSRSPLFQVMFTLQGSSSEVLHLPGLTLAPLASDVVPAKFDLLLTLSEATGGYVGSWIFNRDLFDGATIGRMIGHFKRLLGGIVDALPFSASRPLSELPLLSPEESDQLLVEWNRTATGYPRESAIPELFAEVARRAPDAVAVVQGGRHLSSIAHLSYAELDRRAGRLARRLATLGVGPDVPVGVCLERSAEAVIAVLGVVQAGGAYVPIDPGYPQERLDFLLRDAGVPVLVTEERLLPSLPATAATTATVLCLDREAARQARSQEDEAMAAIPAIPAVPGPDSLAYVIYTSGSTGLPKGVGVPHRAVARLVRESRFADLGADQVFLQLAPLSFDASTLEIWGPLANGGRLVVAPPGAVSLDEIGDLVARHGITTLWLTAGLFHQMVEGPLEGLAPLTQLLAGGDVLSAPHVRRALAGLPGTRLVNGYGPTENTTFTCCHPMSAPEDVGLAVPLGRPIANTRVYLLDRHHRPVPVGVAGELYAGGDGLARGYFRRPDLTAERFVPAGPEITQSPATPENPAAADVELPGARLYRTGDLARWLADGRVEFLGRIDAQVKVRGFRIEPAEIEAALAAHALVREAAVLALAPEGGGSAGARERRLVAYVVPAAGREVTAEALRDALRRRLPDYMVPAAVVLLPSLPLSPNGKVDRRALAELGWIRPEAEGDVQATHTPAEELLAGLWCEVLGIERVGVDQDFFTLGGNSLLATQVAHRIREAFGIEVPLRRLFERTTLAELAREIEEGQAGGALGVPPLPPLALAPRDRPRPASFFQEWGWHLQGGPVSAVLNMPVAQGLTGRLDVAALAWSLAEVARRHEALRTHFAWEDGRLVQVVAPPGHVPLPLADLSALPGEMRLPLVRQLIAQEAETPFDMSRGPLTRALLVRVHEEGHAFLLNMHHALSDGWSSELLQREIAVLYGARIERRPSPLPEPPLQYGDFAWWQREAFSGAVLDGQLAYWRRRLANLPPPTGVPTDRPRPESPTFKSRTERLVVMGEAARQLRRAAQEAGCTLSMALLAGILALVHRYTGGEDLLLATLFSGRTRPELAGIIGVFLNTVILRTDLSGRPTFRQLMQRVRGDMLEGYGHQDVPFPLLLSELFQGVAPSRTALSRIAFNMLSFSESPEKVKQGLPGLDVAPFPAGEEKAKHDITFTCSEDENADVQIHLRCSADLFTQPSLEKIIIDYAYLLEQAAFDPETALDDLLPDACYGPALLAVAS